MRVVVIAETVAQASAFAASRKWKQSMTTVVSPRSPHGARGLTSPVYATPEVKEHKTYGALLEECAPAGLFVDTFRVA